MLNVIHTQSTHFTLISLGFALGVIITFSRSIILKLAATILFIGFAHAYADGFGADTLKIPGDKPIHLTYVNHDWKPWVKTYLFSQRFGERTVLSHYNTWLSDTLTYDLPSLDSLYKINSLWVTFFQIEMDQGNEIRTVLGRVLILREEVTGNRVKRVWVKPEAVKMGFWVNGRVRK